MSPLASEEKPFAALTLGHWHCSECPLGSNVHIELWKQRRWMLNRAAEPWCQVDIQIMNDERDVRNVHGTSPTYHATTWSHNAN